MSSHKIKRGKGDIDFVAIQKPHLWKSEYYTVSFVRWPVYDLGPALCVLFRTQNSTSRVAEDAGVFSRWL